MVENLKSRTFFIVVMLLLAVGAMVWRTQKSGSTFQLGLDLKGGVTLRYQLPDVENQSAAEAEENMRTVREIFGNRLDSTGVRDVTIRSVGNDQIEVGIPGIQASEAEAFKAVLQSVGRLEYRLVAVTEPGVDVTAERDKLENYLDQLRQAGTPITPDLGLSHLTQDLKLETAGGPVTFRWSPVSAKFAPDYCKDYGFPYDPDVVNWELIRFESDSTKYFTGEQIAEVRPDTDGNTGLPAVGFSFKPGKDAADFSSFTSNNIGAKMCILLDGQIQSIAGIRSKISGPGVITGGSEGFSQDELRRLIAVIRSGSLPVKPRLDSQVEVGPSLGQDSIDLGLRASLLSLALVLVFMIFYYRKGGFVACTALAVNMLLLLGTLSFLEATLTLPGIAGLILTIGMAVDANILIFERIREEHDKGKTLAQAVKSGFEKAFFTIIDANVTTFLTAFFLFQFGTGPIRGFAVILMIGLASSLFSSLYFSKTVFAWLIERNMEKLSMLRLLSEPKIGFLKHHKKAFVGSTLAILAGLTLFFMEGRDKYGMDFTGGFEVQLQFDQGLAQADVRARIQERFAGAEVVTVGAVEDGKATRFQIKIKSGPEQAKAQSTVDDGAPADLEPGDEYGRALRQIFQQELVTEPITGLVLGEPTEQGHTPFEANLNYSAEVERSALESSLQRFPDVQVTGDEVGSNFHIAGAFLRVETEDTAKAKISQVARTLPSPDGSDEVLLSNPVPSRSYIGPRVGVELRDAALRAIFFSLLGIIIYVRIRFRQYRFGFAACLALIHDVLFTLGALALIRMTGLVDVEIDLAIIAAFLTIIGYSLNDTIVIFDRVRENLPRSTGQELSDILDRSINQTLSRTILTSLTTLISVIILFAFNVGQRNVLEGFAFSLIIGVLVGTYSTMFVASPAVVRLAQWISRRKEASAS